MSLTAAGGFVVFLLSVAVVQSQNEGGVTYTSTQICALKGSTVNIRSTYTYPFGKDTKMEKTIWFTGSDHLVDLQTDSRYAGRVHYKCRRSDCTLTITDLRESDSAEYKFNFITTNPDGNFTGSPGVALSVVEIPDPHVEVEQSGPCSDTYTDQCVWAELWCRNSCPLSDLTRYFFYIGGKIVQTGTADYFNGYIGVDNMFSCAIEGYEKFPSPSVYVPKVPSVSFGSSGEIIEGSSVTLTCSSDANPPVTKYTWYKVANEQQEYRREGQQFVFSFINSSDSGLYYCTAENKMGSRKSENISIDVKYAPKAPSVSVTPGQIVEGSSVNLSCSSDANPAAEYSWYKKNRNRDVQLFTENNRLDFGSIQFFNLGEYYCAAENNLGRKTSGNILIDVKYAPKLPSVSVSSHIAEGSPVTLSCSSDANPAAHYLWYKEDEPAPIASGQNFTIREFKPEDHGNYYCEAQNNRGRHNSTLHMIVPSGSWKAVAAGVTVAVLLPIILLSVFLLVRRKRGSKKLSKRDSSKQMKEVTGGS